jgi:Na+-driven multidrug efflux pump
MFRILSPSVIFFSLYTVLLGAFQGGGDAKPPMVLNIIRLWGLRVPLAYLMILGLGMGALGLWWAMFISNMVVAAAAWILYETNRWSRALDPLSL